jgi:hypothetical protein
MEFLMRSKEQGSLLIAAIGLIVVIAGLVVSLGFLTVSDQSSGGGQNQSNSALLVAQTGLEQSIYEFSQLGTACASLPSGTAGAGSYAIAGTAYPTAAVASTLTGAGITSASAVGAITVSSIANFAPHGRIRIEDEEIDYASTSTSASVCGTAPCFVSWRRGANGTTAASHGAVPVFQDDQCLVKSTGTVGRSVRVLEATVK